MCRQLRETTRCPICDKPREGVVQIGSGGSWQNTYSGGDRVGDEKIGDLPTKSIEESGGCIHARAYFYAAHNPNALLADHWAHLGIVVGFMGDGDRGIVRLDLVTDKSLQVRSLRAEDFETPVTVEVYCPDRDVSHLVFQLVPLVEKAQAA
jgi:hypothetical protein